MTQRQRSRRCRELRDIRRERDYEIGQLQYANRPYTLPSVKPPNTNAQAALTTQRFVEARL